MSAASQGENLFPFWRIFYGLGEKHFDFASKIMLHVYLNIRSDRQRRYDYETNLWGSLNCYLKKI